MEQLNTYMKARSEIGKLFKNDQVWFNIIDQRHVQWLDEDPTIFYGEEDPETFSFQLLNQKTNRWKYNGLTMFLGKDYSGNTDLYMLTDKYMIHKDQYTHDDEEVELFDDETIELF